MLDIYDGPLTLFYGNLHILLHFESHIHTPGMLKKYGSAFSCADFVAILGTTWDKVLDQIVFEDFSPRNQHPEDNWGHFRQENPSCYVSWSPVVKMMLTTTKERIDKLTHFRGVKHDLKITFDKIR